MPCLLNISLSIRIAFLAALALFASLFHVNRNSHGVIRLDAADSYALLIYSQDRKPERGSWFSRDSRPEWSFWGQEDREVESRRCVYYGAVEPGKQQIELRPGSYTVVAHRKSSCGYYGGSSVLEVAISDGTLLNIGLK